MANLINTIRSMNEAPEDNMPASPDEGKMAYAQCEFIEYASEEICDYIENGGNFPEWFQNKLTKAHEQMKDLHAFIEGEKRATGTGQDPEEMDEAMDPVNKKALKKDFDDRKDKDIDNDGDTDDSDEYLHNRRKAVSKAIKGEGKGEKVEVNPKLDEENLDGVGSSMMHKEEVDIYEAVTVKLRGGKVPVGQHKFIYKVDKSPKYIENSIKERDKNAKVEVKGKEVHVTASAGAHSSFIGSLRKFRANGTVTEEIQMDDMSEGTMSRYELIKKAAQKVNKADNKAARDAAKDIKKDKDLKKPNGRPAGFAEEVITEGNAAAELKKYANAKGGIDKQDFIAISNMIAKKKSAKDLAMVLRAQDTDPRDKALEIINKADKKLGADIAKAMGMRQLRAWKEHVELGEDYEQDKKNAPFKADPEKKKQKNSDGTETKPMSKAKQLAKKGMSEEEMEEAVGTAAKYADKKGMMGGKYDSNTHAFKSAMGSAYKSKKASERQREHEKQDPKMSKGYARNIVDTEKAQRKATKKGLGKQNISWQQKNSAQDRKLPEEFKLVTESEMTDAQKRKREEIVKGMKDKASYFERKYGDRAKDVMYATATKMAMKEGYELTKEMFEAYVAPSDGGPDGGGTPPVYTTKKGTNYKNSKAIGPVSDPDGGSATKKEGTETSVGDVKAPVAKPKANGTVNKVADERMKKQQVGLAKEDAAYDAKVAATSKAYVDKKAAPDSIAAPINKVRSTMKGSSERKAMSAYNKVFGKK